MQHLINYAMQFVGRPYIWGGDDPMRGYDCSGYVQDLLHFAGEDPPGDQTAQALFNHFSEPTKGKYGIYGPGALAFYGKDAKHVTHIAFCIDQYRCLEAAGGGSTTLTENDAIKQNAFIRGGLIKRRSDFLCVIKPMYLKIGLLP